MAGTLLRRATDPWESHESGITNTPVPDPEIPSHQGLDAQSVDPDLDVVTMAVKFPETLAHLHYWSVQMTRPASKDEVLDAFRTSSTPGLRRPTLERSRRDQTDSDPTCGRREPVFVLDKPHGSTKCDRSFARGRLGLR